MPSATLIYRLGLLFASYYLAARIGLLIPYVGSHITLVWLPSGIAVAAYLRWGAAMAPAVTLAALTVNLHTGAPFWVGVMVGAGNAASPALASWLMRRWGMDQRLGRRKDVALLLSASALGMLVSATNGVAALRLSGLLPAGTATAAWLSWWVGDTIGVVLGGVPLLTMPAGAWWQSRPTTPRTLEFAVLFGALLLVAAIVFGRPMSALGNAALPLLFVPSMLIALLALRGGLFVASLAILVLALTAASGTALGLGPFAIGSVHFGLLALWGYVVTLAVTTMLICALVGELDLSQKRLLALFSHAHDGLLLLDAGGRVVEANPAATRLLGRSEAGLRGTPLWRLESGATSQESTLSSLLAQPPIVDAESSQLHVGRLLRNDGSSFDAEIEFARYIDSSGALRAHAVFRDITERQRAEADRRKAESAERASRAKTEFLSRMSHELRTPLNAVLGFAQLLEHDAAGLPPAQRNQVDHIARAGEHLLQLINEVLDLSRIEAGAVSLQLEPVDLARIADDALSLLRQTAQARGVTLLGPAAGSGDSGPVHAWADATRTKEVVVNLLDNAIKFTGRGGKAWLSLESSGDNAPVVIEIADTGCGIAPEQLEHLFEPFNRLGAERSDVGGTGIGLVISRHLVEAMNGRLLVRSTPGEGSVFRVELPRAAAGALPGSPGMPLTAAQPPAQRPPAMRKLLYVEDNEVNALLMQAMLDTCPDIELCVAATGAQALAQALRSPPDLVLIDLHLPDITGLEVLRALRAIPLLARVPCIAASADAMPETIASALAAGFDAYLTKPLSLDELKRCIDSHLDERQGA